MKRHIRSALIFSVLLLAGFNAVAEIEIHQFKDAETEARFVQLSDELRCPKCQNTNLSGSDAPIAKDLRNQLVRLLKEGKTDQEIQHYMLDRYGDFVLYRPVVKKSTWVLWFGPLVLLLIGVLIASRLIARKAIKGRKPETGIEADTETDQSETGYPSALTDSEQQRLSKLMQSNDTTGKDKT
ncbi:MAG: cytochrome c-type biogenesis protein CcmH [Pseudomonadales bacterium]|nr:cytochrome c-type biogenesis protein CcmH [Pseudomonadales bacterium]